VSHPDVPGTQRIAKFKRLAADARTIGERIVKRFYTLLGCLVRGGLSIDRDGGTLPYQKSDQSEREKPKSRKKGRSHGEI